MPAYLENNRTPPLPLSPNFEALRKIRRVSVHMWLPVLVRLITLFCEDAKKASLSPIYRISKRKKIAVMIFCRAIDARGADTERKRKQKQAFAGKHSARSRCQAGSEGREALDMKQATRERLDPGNYRRGSVEILQVRP